MAVFKLLGSFIVGTVGLYFLYRGKKTQNPGFMLWGGILLVLSYLVFM